MPTPRTAAHVGWRAIKVAALLAAASACGAIEDNVAVTDGAVQPGFDYDASAGLTGGSGGGSFDAGGGVTGGSAGGGVSGGGGTGGGAPGWPGDGGSDAGGPIVGSDAGLAGAADAAAPGGDSYAELRQLCVDTINMYRATEGLPPLMRASAALETCSDQGAQYDGELNRGKPFDQVMGHASTQVPGKGRNGQGPGRLCGSPELGAQNTCPGWPVGPRTGNATLADALKRCLAQMWAEGRPPQGVESCKAAYFAGDPSCFLEYGHWISMAEPTGRAVACGFFDMGNNTFWMNQDFVGPLLTR